MEVKLGNQVFPHSCVVVPNLAVEIVIGMDFIRSHKCLKGLLFEGTGAIMCQKGEGDLELLPLGRPVSTKKLPSLYQRLTLFKREDYRLNPEVLKSTLGELGVSMEDIKVEWFATPENSIFDSYCTPSNSIYKFFLPSLGFSYANPPWSHLERILTKLSLEGGKVALVTPDWEGVSWRPLLDDLTSRRAVVKPGTPLYSVGGGADLPSPPWNTIVSICEGPGQKPLRPELVRHLCRSNLGFGPAETTKGQAIPWPSQRPSWPTHRQGAEAATQGAEAATRLPPLILESDDSDDEIEDLARPSPDFNPGTPEPMHTSEWDHEAHEEDPVLEVPAPATEEAIQEDPSPISPTLPPASPIMPPSPFPSFSEPEGPEIFYL